MTRDKALGERGAEVVMVKANEESLQNKKGKKRLSIIVEDAFDSEDDDDMKRSPWGINDRLQASSGRNKFNA